MKSKKNNFVLLSSIALAFTLFNCSSNDNEIIIQEAKTPNQAPEAFSLIAVTDAATQVTVTPTFSWNAATDPDGDPVTYEVFIGSNSNSTTNIASAISETNYTVEERLPLNKDLFWNVVAIDSERNETSSETFSFTTRDLQIPDVPVTTNAAFLERTDHTSIVFNDKIWIIGGYDGFSYLNDIWQSSDGETWTQVTDEAPFHKRSGHIAVVFDNKIWVIGGYNGVDFLRDIWQSADGENWTKITGVSPFPQNGLHNAVVFKDKLWVIGSLNAPAKLSNNIWQSTDGETWTPVDVTVPFPERYRHTTMVYDDKIWIIGGSRGGILNDVWQSADGSEWIRVTEETAMEGISDHTSVVFDSKMWIIGGRNNMLSTNRIWQSSDGETWSQVTAEAPFAERRGHTSVIFDNKIWIIGGRGGILGDSYLNDVWSMD
ncbi:kelch-like protein [Maribacter hydrothermalis]|uniref:Kelch motif-containing protein n=1 Tax=Maribacter hydrothermalis TaxID=1836467 RepID=A0A1B7ZBX7_9FLAO|nr:kelch-like protein [Maribacter hydrothermalis]APQ16011.1 hypothetical protein BTR34_01050 [Maribacter hydrothermalis]OBR40428.1 hypothetical protein A9200_16255 [Maribacter hydrothermalis]